MVKEETPLHLLIDAIEYNVNKFGKENEIIDLQINSAKNCFYITSNQINVLLIQRKINIIMIEFFNEYIKQIKQTSVFNLFASSFQKAICCHFEALRKIDLSKYINQIESHQVVIAGILKIPIFKYSMTHNEIINSLTYLFPFSFLLKLFRKRSFFEMLLNIVMKYKIKKNKIILTKIYNYVKKYHLGKFSSLAISDLILAFFVNFKYDEIFHDHMFDFHVQESLRAIKTKLLKPEEIETVLSNSSLNKPGFSKDNILFDLSEIKCNNSASDFCSIPSLQYISLEFRKSGYKISPFLKVLILSHANEMLNQVTRDNFIDVSTADEMLFLHLSILSDASIPNISIYRSVINTLLPYDFLIFQIPTYISLLNRSLEFILSFDYDIESQENYLYPFKTNKDDKPILIHGFQIYAYPRFFESNVPAVCIFSGNYEDIGIFYQSKLVFKEEDAIQAYNGLIYLHNDIKDLIKVNDGDYESNKSLIDTVSNLQIMTSKIKSSLEIDNIPALYSSFQKEWGLEDRNPSTVIQMIYRLQIYLVKLGKLDKNFIIDGVIEKNTLDAINSMRSLFNKNCNYLSQSLYNAIVCTNNLK